MPPVVEVVDFIQQEIAAGSFPGAGLLVHHQGRPVIEFFEGSYCSGSVRDNVLDRDVSHMLYSFSKGVSATVIAIAQQKKLIDYDAPLRLYIPGYHGKGKDDTTIRQLLNHTAGIPNCPLNSVATEDLWAEALQCCCKARVEWRPGSRSEYHAKTGLFLAAEALRSRLPGRPSWEEICREWLLDPIGARTMTFRIPEKRPLSLTPPPEKLPWEVTPEHFPHLGHPGGGIFGRLDDMIRVLQFHLNGGSWNGRQILNREHVEEMRRVQYRKEILETRAQERTPAFEPYGVGWRIKLNQQNDGFGLGNRTPEGTFGHAGIGTVMSVAIPQKDLAIAFLCTRPVAIPADQERIRNHITDLIYEASN